VAVPAGGGRETESERGMILERLDRLVLLRVALAMLLLQLVLPAAPLCGQVEEDHPCGCFGGCGGPPAPNDAPFPAGASDLDGEDSATAPDDDPAVCDGSCVCHAVATLMAGADSAPGEDARSMDPPRPRRADPREPSGIERPPRAR